jgi:uncharacterized repeat protein (TIGR02543 family)
MAAKIFEVNDVLPATTQLRISWTVDETTLNLYYSSGSQSYVRTTVSPQYFLIDAPAEGRSTYLTIAGVNICEFDNDNNTFEGWNTPYTAPSGNHAYIDIDTSLWSLEKRTVTMAYDFTGDSSWFLWEDLNAPSGYTITFNSNGGTTITDLTEQTTLPTPLPIPTKSGYTFVAWYYESNFQTRAKAGDTIESNVTLYAKWHNLGSLFTEIADAIRSKDGTSETIRDVDFGERIKQIQGAKEEESKTVTPNFSSGNQVITPTSGKVLSQVTLTKPTDLLPENIAKDKNVCGVVGTSFIAIELTQTQYDALSTKDSNTYYLIVEVE